ncbi:SCO family protein [Stappia taiwanensis]|uniref:SCO family protein n=1 Tax=Stappia taiwanensis TaxID=992267 RepID=A0A838XZE7_9HYPH|nr:SCO family protein [Stappia taiwanensis]MBA4612223.1 SCO family protein [Stappia taiwanensis]
MSGLKLVRYGAWAAVAALLGVVAYVSLDYYRGGKDGSVIAPLASIGGPFTLTDGSTGKIVTEADFKGKPTAYFFGFTFCPDVCPTTLAEVQSWIETLGPDADKMNFAFVSVDPERDTPEVMRDYVAAFDKRIRPLSGTREQTDAIIKAYRVYARRVELDGGDYTMDHSAAIFLMDSDNRFVGTIAYEEDPKNAMAKLRRLIDNAAS